jgi:hypothetical protein
MATPGELAKVAAAVLGLPEVQVLSTHRALRQADLVSKHGRGLAAAKMTPTDAAKKRRRSTNQPKRCSSTYVFRRSPICRLTILF